MKLLPFVGHSAEALTTLDSAGNVGADFSGHIHATGLDLDAVTVFDDVNSIRWIRLADGTTIAQIQGLTDAGGRGSISLRGMPRTNANDGSGELRVDAPDTAGAGFTCSLNPAGSPTRASVSASAGGPGLFGGGGLIGDSNGNSDFIRAKEWRGRAYMANAYNLPAGVFTNIPLDTVDYDLSPSQPNAGQWDPGAKWFQIQKDGIYAVTGQVCCQAAAGAGIDQGISFTITNPVNQFGQTSHTKAGAALFQSILGYWEGPLVFGQRVQLAGYITGGSPLAQLANKGTYLAIRRVGNI